MYTSKDQVLAKLPAEELDAALLDRSEGLTEAEAAARQAAVWDSITEGAADEIHGYLAQQYAVPFGDPVPYLVKAASLIFVLESIFQRRGFFAETNIYTAQADKWRDKLGKIGAGTEPLVAGAKKATVGVIITSLPTKAHSRLNS